MAGVDLPLLAIRRQMTNAIQVIVQTSRLPDGSRKIVRVSEVEGMQGDTITMQDRFVSRAPGQAGADQAQAEEGRLEATGFRPPFASRLHDAGFELDPALFTPR